MTPVTSSSLVPTSTSNESHTRSDELRARSNESHTTASRSFQIHHPRVSHSCSTSFALVPDSQLTVAIDRGQATTVLSEHHNKEQRKRTQRRSATMFAVFLLCVLRARYDLLLDTKGLCASHGCHCAVLSWHVQCQTQVCVRSCKSVKNARWSVKNKNALEKKKQPDREKKREKVKTKSTMSADGKGMVCHVSLKPCTRTCKNMSCKTWVKNCK